MTPQEAVAALYQQQGTWRGVAGCCNALGAKHPGAYYRKIALGQIVRPARSALHGITMAAGALLGSNVTAVTSSRRVSMRRGLSVTPDVFDRLVAAKSVRGDVTWNELFTEAASLLESRSVTGSVTE
jgi:hypothetical protein